MPKIFEMHPHTAKGFPYAAPYMPKTCQVHRITCQISSRCILLHAKDLPGASFTCQRSSRCIPSLRKVFHMQRLTCQRPARCILLLAKNLPCAAPDMQKTFQMNPITCQRPLQVHPFACQIASMCGPYMKKIFHMQPITCQIPSMCLLSLLVIFVFLLQYDIYHSQYDLKYGMKLLEVVTEV